MKTYIIFNCLDIEHIEPTLEIVKELIRRGNIVIYYSGLAYKSMLEKVGAEFRNYPQEIGDIDFTRDIKEVKRQKKRIKLHKELAMRLASDVQLERPTCILYDSLCLFAKILANEIQVPCVGLISGFVEVDVTLVQDDVTNLTRIERFKYQLKYYKAVNKQKRIKKFETTHANYSPYTDVNYIYSYEEFHPYASLLDERFKFAGYPVEQRTEIQSKLACDKLNYPLIYVSLSPHFSSPNDLIHELKLALSDFTGRVVIDPHLKLDHSLLSDQMEILTVPLTQNQWSNVMCLMTDGGLKRVHLGLCHTIPFVLIPQTNEQKKLAKRVEECMVGIIVADVKQNQLQDSLEILSSDTRYMANAKLLSKNFYVKGGAGRLIYEIEQYLK
ncbi:MAG: hypothetical protein ACRCST_00925 [Turicibacter sp.]